MRVRSPALRLNPRILQRQNRPVTAAFFSEILQQHGLSRARFAINLNEPRVPQTCAHFLVSISPMQSQPVNVRFDVSEGERGLSLQGGNVLPKRRCRSKRKTISAELFD